MKQLLTILTFLTLSLSALGQSATNVIICDSDGATRYHVTTCYGMDRCTHDRDTVTLTYAVSIGRSACKICYKSTSGSSSNGSSSGDGTSSSSTGSGACSSHGGVDNISGQS